MRTPAENPRISLVIEELHDSAAWTAAYPVVCELRNNLIISEYLKCIAAARDAGSACYRGWLAREGEDGPVVAFLGARFLSDLVHGPHLYVDDLVVRAAYRSRGYGAELLRFAERLARTHGARGVRLCTGVANADAIRFYQREGWQQRAVVFKKGFI